MPAGNRAGRLDVLADTGGSLRSFRSGHTMLALPAGASTRLWGVAERWCQKSASHPDGTSNLETPSLLIKNCL
jgi:hypothetical protein